LFDETSLVPLLIHAPKYPASFGKRYSRPVELIDIFPTLVDLAAVPLEESCPNVTDISGAGQSSSFFVGAVELREAPVRKSETQMLRHKYCDKLDGVSLAPVFAHPYKMSKKDKNVRKNAAAGARLPSAISVTNVEDNNSPVSDYRQQHRVGSSLSVKEAEEEEEEESSFRKPFDFALTQKMTCKLPGRLDNDPYTDGWTDFCPFKKLPRNPPFGAMGYSMRMVDWRYTVRNIFALSMWLFADSGSIEEIPSFFFTTVADPRPFRHQSYWHPNLRPPLQLLLILFYFSLHII
jgi:hypothetical protein